MRSIIKYSIFILIIITLSNGCVYIETFTPTREFFVQLDTNFHFDSSKHDFEIINGEIEICDFKNQIYKVIFFQSDGGKTKIFGQTINETSNGFKYDRLFLYEWEDHLNRRSLISLSYNKILLLDSFKLEGVSFYKLPKINNDY